VSCLDDLGEKILGIIISISYLTVRKFCGISILDMTMKGEEWKVAKGLGKIIIKIKNSMFLLKRDANNIVARRNCWNFVTIMVETNDYVQFLKLLCASLPHSRLFSIKRCRCLSIYFVI
jgi:hypothetical protein